MNEISQFLFKLGAKIKKWRSETADVFTIQKLNEALITELVSAYGVKEALNKIFLKAWEMGHEFMLELKSVLPKDVDMIPAIGHAAWLLFSGREPTKITFDKNYKVGEYTLLKLTLIDENSPWCRGIESKFPFGVFPAGAYQGASQTWSVLTRHDFKTFARETKCKATGDPYCELTLLFAPHDMPIEVLKKEHPEFFEWISIGFKEIE